MGTYTHTLAIAFCLSILGSTSTGAPQPSDQAVIFVDLTATGANNGTNWANAYTNLQSALATASGGQQIWVARGTYVPGKSRGSTFQLVSQVAMYGGFAGTETSLDQRDWVANPTRLSGEIPGPNVYHVTSAAGSAKGTVVDGFWVVNGDADSSAPVPQGGAMRVSGGTLDVRNTVFFFNHADARGGAVSASDAAIRFYFCGFWYNSSAGQGGAVDDDSANLRFTRCYFGRNEAFRGGAINKAGGSGPILDNSILYRNTAADSGGAIEADFGAPELVNCTLVENVAGTQGGGLYLYTAVQLTMTNCILWDNSDASGTTQGGQVSKSGDPGTTITANYCCVKGLMSVWGVNNITADPLFVNQAAEDLHLTPCSVDPCSPCIDAGTNSVLTTPGILDFEGNPRALDGNGDGLIIVDMGAYEASL